MLNQQSMGSTSYLATSHYLGEWHIEMMAGHAVAILHYKNHVEDGNMCYCSETEKQKDPVSLKHNEATLSFSRLLNLRNQHLVV